MVKKLTADEQALYDQCKGKCMNCMFHDECQLREDLEQVRNRK